MEKVENKLMYHFHKPKIKPEEWKVDNEIIIDNNYNSPLVYNSVYKNGTGLWINDDKFESAVFISEEMVQKGTDEYMLSLIENREEYLKRVKQVREFLGEICGILRDLSIANREMGLEDYRIKHHPEYLSRFHSLWVCEKEQLEYWEKMLNKECELYELSLTGTILRANAAYLPNFGFSRERAESVSEKYWNIPQIRDKSKDEFLFQGKARILRKVII